mmetsp:Transcript_83080/g.231152  ORF Transcript_83080/g.231152 Transcript_83080/m.231152 type:complete len:208 (+) Transcript_83080:492-1115(+)
MACTSTPGAAGPRGSSPGSVGLPRGRRKAETKPSSWGSGFAWRTGTSTSASTWPIFSNRFASLSMPTSMTWASTPTACRLGAGWGRLLHAAKRRSSAASRSSGFGADASLSPASRPRAEGAGADAGVVNRTRSSASERMTCVRRSSSAANTASVSGGSDGPSRETTPSSARANAGALSGGGTMRSGLSERNSGGSRGGGAAPRSSTP